MLLLTSILIMIVLACKQLIKSSAFFKNSTYQFRNTNAFLRILFLPCLEDKNKKKKISWLLLRKPKEKWSFLDYSISNSSKLHFQQTLQEKYQNYVQFCILIESHCRNQFCFVSWSQDSNTNLIAWVRTVCLSTRFKEYATSASRSYIAR